MPRTARVRERWKVLQEPFERGEEMNKERIQEIRDRCDRATEGPWQWVGRDLEVVDASHPSKNNNFGAIIEIPTESCCEYGCCGGHSPVFAEDKKDEDFIAHSRKDLPDALDYIEKLQEERDEALDNLSDARALLDVVPGLKASNEKLSEERDEAVMVAREFKKCLDLFKNCGHEVNHRSIFCDTVASQYKKALSLKIPGDEE